MPDSDYPDGYAILEDDGEGNLQLTTLGLTGLMLLGALMGIGSAVFGVGGALGATAVTTETTSVLTTISVSDAEAMIIEEMIAAGGTEADAEAFIFQMARQRALNAFMSEEASTELATAEAAYVMLRASQNQSTITAAIITAAANVNEQQALSLFFASGM